MCLSASTTCRAIPVTTQVIQQDVCTMMLIDLQAPDVMYFAFTGDDAVDPNAGTDVKSLAALGQTLLARIG